MIVVKGQKGRVFQLKKGLHRLKQSPCAWFGRVSQAMIQDVYKRCHANHTFLKRSNDKVAMLVAYVDDIVVTWNGEKEFRG